MHICIEIGLLAFPGFKSSPLGKPRLIFSSSRPGEPRKFVGLNSPRSTRVSFGNAASHGPGFVLFNLSVLKRQTCILGNVDVLRQSCFDSRTSDETMPPYHKF